MRTGSIAIAALAFCLAPALSQTNAAQAATYLASDLLTPCQNADNDSRWGEGPEKECEQYLYGFSDALTASGQASAMGICVPEQNAGPEMRWAFVKWVHGDFTARRMMSAGDAVLGTLKEAFACK